VPGHEVGGVVVAIGSKVTGYAIGDHAGVGCMVDSCRSCGNCKKGSEQYCETGMVSTYNSTHKYGVESGTDTYGGYAQSIVVDKAFALKIPMNLDLAAATPLLCAGITVYSPMMQYGLRPNMRLGIIGLGGLGHMGVKLGKAFGCHTTVISRGEGKKDDSLNNLKAHAYLDSKNAEQMEEAAKSLDFIICTVSAEFDPTLYLNLLDIDGKFIVVGAPPAPVALGLPSLIFSRRMIGGSLIGGVQETQEMLDFCGRYNIVCDIEMIGATGLDESYNRCVAGDVKYRFVVDTSTF
jgi:uncharacterized zinc-type alcohol dehydrogenase-like protein